MFNIGPPELIVILLVALLIVGPKRLPEVGKSVGKALREIRRQTDEVRSSFEMNLDDDEPDEPYSPGDSDGSDAGAAPSGVAACQVKSVPSKLSDWPLPLTCPELWSKEKV